MELFNQISSAIDNEIENWCEGCPDADHFAEPEEWVCSRSLHPTDKDCYKHKYWRALVGKAEEMKEIVEEAI